MTPVTGCAEMDCSADDAAVSAALSSTPGVAVVSEHVTLVALVVLPLCASDTTTTPTSCGSTSIADDASDAMKEEGGTDNRLIVSAAVVRRSSGDVSDWPHMLQLARINAVIAGDASIIRLAVVVTAVPAGAAASMTSVQESAAPSRALRSVAFTSTNSHSAVTGTSNAAPPLVVAGVIVVTAKRNGTVAYPSTVAGACIQSSARCVVDSGMGGRRTRSPLGVQVHSAYTINACPSGAACADKPAKATPAQLAFAVVMVAETDDSTIRGDTNSSDLFIVGGVADAGSSTARQDSAVDAIVGVLAPSVPTIANTAGRAGNTSGTTTNGSGHPVVFQSARHAASVTIGLTCSAVDATRPMVSMHDAVSVPVQPDAPATVNAFSSKSFVAVLVSPLALTANAAAGVDTVMLAGRDASAGLDVAHELAAMVMVQVAASCDCTRSVGPDTTMPPGAARLAVETHDTAKMAG